MSAGQQVIWTSQLLSIRADKEIEISRLRSKITNLECDIQDAQLSIQVIDDLCKKAVAVDRPAEPRDGYCSFCGEMFWVVTVDGKITREFCRNPACVVGEGENDDEWQSWG